MTSKFYEQAESKRETEATDAVNELIRELVNAVSEMAGEEVVLSIVFEPKTLNMGDPIPIGTITTASPERSSEMYMRAALSSAAGLRDEISTIQ